MTWFQTGVVVNQISSLMRELTIVTLRQRERDRILVHMKNLETHNTDNFSCLGSRGPKIGFQSIKFLPS